MNSELPPNLESGMEDFGELGRPVGMENHMLPVEEYRLGHFPKRPRFSERLPSMESDDEAVINEETDLEDEEYEVEAALPAMNRNQENPHDESGNGEAPAQGNWQLVHNPYAEIDGDRNQPEEAVVEAGAAEAAGAANPIPIGQRFFDGHPAENLYANDNADWLNFEPATLRFEDPLQFESNDSMYRTFQPVDPFANQYGQRYFDYMPMQLEPQAMQYPGTEGCFFSLNSQFPDDFQSTDHEDLSGHAEPVAPVGQETSEVQPAQVESAAPVPAKLNPVEPALAEQEPVTQGPVNLVPLAEAMESWCSQNQSDPTVRKNPPQDGEPTSSGSENSHPCKVCHVEFESRQVLSEHVIVHYFDLKNFCCVMCGKYVEKEKLEDHGVVHHTETSVLTCNHGNARKWFRGEVVQCNVCFTLVNPSELRSHVLKEHSPNVNLALRGNHCKNTSQSEFNPDKDFRMSEFYCHECSIFVDRRESLYPSPMIAYMCNCGFKSRSKERVHEHFKKNHLQYDCSCGIKCGSLEEATEHAKIHYNRLQK